MIYPILIIKYYNKTNTKNINNYNNDYNTLIINVSTDYYFSFGNTERQNRFDIIQSESYR